MALEVQNEGVGNEIAIDETLLRTGTGRVRVTGADNRLLIAAPYSCASLDIQLSGGSRVEIGERCSLGHLTIFARDRGELRIGADTAFGGRASLLMHEQARLSIGQRCLLGADFTATISDMHSIVDMVTQLRVNPPADVVIADHVWVGANVTVLKGSVIGAHSIIGFGATVAGRIPTHCLAAGIPARVLRSGVTWRHELMPYEFVPRDKPGAA
jgi:acetyltransferase-like isoleucine patch superfamily enzyme